MPCADTEAISLHTYRNTFVKHLKLLNKSVGLVQCHWTGKQIGRDGILFDT